MFERNVLAGSAPQVMLHPHEHRGAVLEEVHARPFRPLTTPTRLLHFAFVTDSIESGEGRNALAAFCAGRGVEAPRDHVRHHHADFGGMVLTWEQHSEFATYRWQLSDSDGTLFSRHAGEYLWLMAGVGQTGRHLVSVDLQLVAPEAAPAFDKFFDQNSLCVMKAEQGAATIATDFKAQPDGFVRIVVVDHGLGPVRAGALVQRLLELETYRLMALLGLPEAQRLSGPVRAIERGLVEITREMTKSESLEDNQRLLDQLARFAAELEAGAAESLFRFGATRAYESIVQNRLTVLRLEAMPDHETIGGFLNGRLMPALKTCSAIEERQINLSRKLARTTQLLRARIDIDLERQNRDILSTLSERTRMQLSLQRTVEGLSIAAVSYYVVGLASHFFAGIPGLGWHVEPELATAIATPFIVAIVAWVVLGRLRHHGKAADDDSDHSA